MAGAKLKNVRTIWKRQTKIKNKIHLNKIFTYEIKYCFSCVTGNNINYLDY